MSAPVILLIVGALFALAALSRIARQRRVEAATRTWLLVAIIFGLIGVLLLAGR